MEIVNVDKSLYCPVFNPDSDEYEDVSPFYKNQRSIGRTYYCACKSNSGFSTYSQWKNHVNLKIHKDYMNNYKFFNKNLLEAQREIVNYKREIHNLSKKYLGLKLKYKEKTNEIESQYLEKEILDKNISALVKDNYDVREELRIMKEKYDILRKDMDEINDIVVSDSDDELYGDCVDEINIRD